MPYARRSFRRTRRTFRRFPHKGGRRYGKRFGTRPRSKITSMKVRGTIIPDRAFVKLKNNTQQSFAIAAGQSINTVSIPGNYFAETTSQLYPPGIQQWGQLYAGLRTLGSKVAVSISQETSATDSEPIIVGCFPELTSLSGSTGLPTFSAHDVLNQPYCVYRTIGARGGVDTKFFKNFMKTKKMAGQSIMNDRDYVQDIQYADQNSILFGSTSETLAPNSFDWTFFAITADGQVTGSQQNVAINISQTFYLDFVNRRNFITPTDRDI